MSDHPITLARDALERHAWKDAYEALIEADRTDPLPGSALEMLAWATYWTGRPDATIEALERAYAAYLDEGDRAQAAMMAYRLAEQHGMRMSIPLAQGWGQKAARLAEEDATWPVHGWLLWIQGLLLWIMEKDYARRDRTLRRGARVRRAQRRPRSRGDEPSRQGPRALPARRHRDGHAAPGRVHGDGRRR